MLQPVQEDPTGVSIPSPNAMDQSASSGRSTAIAATPGLTSDKAQAPAMLLPDGGSNAETEALTGTGATERRDRLQLVWTSCARAAVQDAVLAVPADWTGAKPGSVLQQSFWRHTHPQVSTLPSSRSFALPCLAIAVSCQLSPRPGLQGLLADLKA